ncbi:MAG: hypothetical protein Q8M47_07080 [Devosia sp.]|nr:hypothetical protein [Devosia sp.]
MSYEHFIRITSQIPFCATPIRLDPYNHCQFSCGYCFAKARMGHGRDGKLQSASVPAFRDRLKRVSRGEVASALDEFLEQRVPVQLGGMSDPFMPAEQDQRVTLGLINVLRNADYPFLVSTKSTLAAEDAYAGILAESKTLVRFSMTGIADGSRRSVDRGTPDRVKVLGRVDKEDSQISN